MRGIDAKVFAIIFSLIIMLLLLGASIGFVQGKTDIPFENLWKLNPETGTVGEGKYVNDDQKNIIDTSDIELDHIFSSGTYLDVSEIACYIARNIYDDYHILGDGGSRADSSTFYWAKGLPKNSEYLVGIGRFNYLQGPNSNSDPDETNITSFDSACHLCRDPPSPPLSSGGTAITHLDEVCISLQLRDRKVAGTIDFCNEPFGASDGDGLFGDNDCGATFNSAAWQSHCGKTNNFPNEFCSNTGQDKIRWSACTDDDTTAWNVTEKDCGGHNSDKLSNNRKYMYGVLWNIEDKKYDVVFAIVPVNSFVAGMSWDYIWEQYKHDNYRRNILGNEYFSARVVADYNFTPTSPVNIRNVLIQNIEIAQKGKVIFTPCSSEQECFPRWISTEHCTIYVLGAGPYTDIRNLPIILLINATKADGTKFGSLPDDKNRDLLTGRTYRVVIQEWFNQNAQAAAFNFMNTCYDRYARSITITEI